MREMDMDIRYTEWFVIFKKFCMKETMRGGVAKEEEGEEGVYEGRRKERNMEGLERERKKRYWCFRKARRLCSCWI